MLALLQRAHGLLNELGCQHDKYESWRFASTLRHYVFIISASSVSQAYGLVPLAVSSANACAPRFVYLGERCAP